MIKYFPTLGVAGVATGICLETGGFSEIHEVMDHLYPGIMTIGCAMMAGHAKTEVLRQHPEFATLPLCTSDNYEAWASDALARFGPTMEIDGPVAEQRL